MQPHYHEESQEILLDIILLANPWSCSGFASCLHDVLYVTSFF